MAQKNYPIFLKINSIKTWYHIEDDHTFTEVKTLGNYYSITKYSDDVLPMRNHISDLLENSQSQETSLTEFEEYVSHLKSEKTERSF